MCERVYLSLCTSLSLSICFPLSLSVFVSLCVALYRCRPQSGYLTDCLTVALKAPTHTKLTHTKLTHCHTHCHILCHTLCHTHWLQKGAQIATRNWFINLHFGAKISANLFHALRFACPSPATHTHDTHTHTHKLSDIPLMHIIFVLLDKINWAPR